MTLDQIAQDNWRIRGWPIQAVFGLSGGQMMNSNGTENGWDYRTVDLSSFAGKTAVNLWITADAGTPVGSWNGWFAEIAIYSSDGEIAIETLPGDGRRILVTLKHASA